MESSPIRNFSIIAHIDHGKSTLADRLLELTGTIEKRKMRDQVLDSMELERERGITIKMQPARMHYKSGGSEYILNLIDTPGHIDFSYEVSRALTAVEGVILLVDATQGIQAQTLTTLGMAKSLGKTILPVLSKIDSPLARVSEIKEEMVSVLACNPDDILACSGKTGEGVAELLEAIVKRVPAPVSSIDQTKSFRGLVFDFQYSNHRGVIVYTRIMDGEVKKGDQVKFSEANESFYVLETGIFSPQEVPTEGLRSGEIGYVVTGIKKPGIASVGDTITLHKDPLPAFPGYMSPRPVVWASVYPESQDDLRELRVALDKLRLSDSSFSFEEESSGTLGRGFRCGFLGMLHLEIITERLRREFSLELIVTSPSITYEITRMDGTVEMVYTPSKFPDWSEHNAVKGIREPWVAVEVILPPQYVSPMLSMLHEHEAVVGDTSTFGDGRMKIALEMPLRELMRNFFDRMKSISSGFASLSYELMPLRDADVVRLDILVADEPVPAFARVVSKARVQEEAERAVHKLHGILPKQLFTTKIQGQALGRILASETLSALRKDVTGYLYGGDITRKKKLWEKQKEGKKRLKERGVVQIPHDVFLKMVKSSEN
jgi:GTP-binding protein LepA